MDIGTDPEFFIYDAEGQFVPAWELFPDKANKITPPGLLGGYGLFRDGAALELNVPPSHCREILTKYVLLGLQAARKMLPKGYTLSSTPTAKVDLSKILRKAPADGMVFGCEPSWNAYTGEFENVNLDATEHPYRYAGGHMHISWKKTDLEVATGGRFAWVKNIKEVRKFIKLLDQYVALPLALWFNKPETFMRRQHYGQAGDFRLQDYGGAFYGIEYRTPGPEIWNSPVPASFAYGAMRAVASNFNKLSKTSFLSPLRTRLIRKAVNSGRDMAALLPTCYIALDGSKSSKASFLSIIAHQRPFQTLLDIPVASHYGYSFDKHVHELGWEEYNSDGRDEAAFYRNLGVSLKDFRLTPAEVTVG